MNPRSLLSFSKSGLLSFADVLNATVPSPRRRFCVLLSKLEVRAESVFRATLGTKILINARRIDVATQVIRYVVARTLRLSESHSKRIG
ncbi:hypothetical protein HYPGJ_21110 [Hyphomicrobium sp. GJ21]|nr:hypothetical protein HYPGJ_21110 [Hyphomicrobium sp. GJ21]